MEREFDFKPVDALQNLHKAVMDGLVIETITVGCKGSKAGVEQEGYWIPDKEQVLCFKFRLHFVFIKNFGSPLFFMLTL